MSRVAAMGLALLLAAVVAVSAGCSRVRVYRLTEDKFAAKPKSEEIRLFVNKVQQPHREIAFIDSQPLSDQSDETREKQLVQIRETARKLGADAVHDVRPLTQRVRGIIVDQAVPFHAYKQGRYKLYFWRGTAIVYTGDSEAVPTESVPVNALPAAETVPPPPSAP